MFHRATTFALVLSALGCLLLTGVRAAHDISVATPLQLTTSGAEEEAIYSVWCAAHGRVVFTDPLRIPYTGSYFNWLFYELYGAVAAAGMGIFHLGDAWLPTICRLFTLVVTFTGAVFFLLALRWSGRRFSTPAALALALLAAFNPLCGLWAMTTRPDMGAAVCEMAGIAFFIRYWRDERVGWLVLSALAFYAAWGFKQISIAAVPAAVLTLLLLGRRRAALVLGGVWLAALGLTFALLGPVYRHWIYGAQIGIPFSLPWGVKQFVIAMIKVPFIALALGGMGWIARHWRRQPSPDPVELGLTLIILASLAVEAPASCKNGAADYYYLPLAFSAPLWLAVTARRLAPHWRNGTVIAAAIIMLLGVAAVLTGLRGTFDNRDPRDTLGHLQRYLATRPGPVFVRDSYGDLPWISPTGPHFVIEYNYAIHLAEKEPFEAGGLDALIGRGYFTTVVEDDENSPPDESLLAAHYRLARGELGLRYFERK